MSELAELETELAGVGHNSAGVNGEAKAQLRGYVEQIEGLEEQKGEVAEDIKAVYAVARAAGFDAKTLRKVIRLRKQKPEVREDEEHKLAVYMLALGMIAK